MHSLTTPNRGRRYASPALFGQMARNHGAEVQPDGYITLRGVRIGLLLPTGNGSELILADLSEVNPRLEARAVTPPPGSIVPRLFMAYPVAGVMVQWGATLMPGEVAMEVRGEVVADRSVDRLEWEGDVARLHALEGEGGSELERCLAAMGWSQARAAEILAVSGPNRVNDWIAGRRDFPVYIRRSLEGWVRLACLGEELP